MDNATRQVSADATVAYKKILVVDGDANMRAVLEFRLGRENYAVQVATDGVDALRQMSSFHPDLVILDLFLRGIDGLSVLQSVRSDPETCDVPVIVLSALSGDGYKDRVNMLGAESYISKPASLRTLVGEVRTLLSNDGPRAGGSSHSHPL